MPNDHRGRNVHGGKVTDDEEYSLGIPSSWRGNESHNRNRISSGDFGVTGRSSNRMDLYTQPKDVEGPHMITFPTVHLNDQGFDSAFTGKDKTWNIRGDVRPEPDESFGPISWEGIYPSGS
jgi:hypothetical protein